MHIVRGTNLKCTIWRGLYTCFNPNPQSRWALEKAPSCIFSAIACPHSSKAVIILTFFYHRFVLSFLELHVEGNTKFAFFCLRLPSCNVMLLRFIDAVFIRSFFLLLSTVALYKLATIFLFIFCLKDSGLLPVFGYYQLSFEHYRARFFVAMLSWGNS